MKMRHQIIPFIVGVSLFLSVTTEMTYAQKSNDNSDTLNAAIYNEISSRNSVTFNRVNEKGELKYCTLSFAFAMRDYTARKGAVIVGDGSINLSFTPGKSNGYLVKLVIRGIDPNDLSAKPIKVDYLDLMIDKKPMKRYKIWEDEGDFQSKLVLLADKDFTISKILTESLLTKISIAFSLKGEKTDKEVFFDKLAPPQQLLSAQMVFLACTSDIIQKHLSVP